MKSACLLQLAFVLSSLTLSKAQDVIGPGLSCLRLSPADGHTRITFLREDSAGARSLYLTRWSEEMRLVTCEISSSPNVTEGYRALCDRSDTRGEEISQRFNISVLLAPDAPCALVSSGRARRDETEKKTRRKRAWTFPGTLWCGSGSTAAGYDQLGMFESADRCCREHDHCRHIIQAFTVNYGVFNPNLYTVSHCECDRRFRECLLGVNDTISSMVGYSFFNIFRVPCFELKQQKQCTAKYWWGMCKVAKEAPYAVFKRQLPFNTSDVTHKYADNNNKLTSNEGQHVTNRPTITSLRKSSKTEHRCLFRDPPRGDTFHRRRTKGRGCKRLQKQYGAAPSQMPSILKEQTTTSAMKSISLPATKGKTLMSNKKRNRKTKNIRKSLSDNSTRRSHIPPQVNTNSDHRSSSTIPSSTRPLTTTTAVIAVTKNTRGHKNVPKQSRCCASRMPARGDTFQLRCKSCLEQEAASHKTSVTLTKTTTIGQFHKDGKPEKQGDSYLPWNNANQKPIAQSPHAERSLKPNTGLHNMTDNQSLCGSLRHLDECEFKIPPLEKKYDLQNMDSKTAYHCDCTSRLAVQIESFRRPSVLPSLLKDFVSQQCFTLPKEKKCHRKKSCSRGFTKASDLHQALRKTEEKDTAGVGISGSDRKRGIPVRLYKRCLRLERKAHIMAQLR